MDGLFEELEETKSNFWKNHESRMEMLNNELSKIDTESSHDEINRDLEEIGKDLDALLSDF